jgi:hypothetical protein
MSSGDLSAPFRQGMFMIGHPQQWLPAFRDMFKAAASEDGFRALSKSIEKMPNYSAMKKGGLALMEVGGNTAREEAYLSSLAEKIPGIGRIIRSSNRGYIGFLNQLRAGAFDDVLRLAKEAGEPKTEKLLKNTASMINAFTGRGDIPKWAAGTAGDISNAFIFSPRLIASRLAILNPATYVNPATSPTLRKYAIKSLLSYLGVNTTMLGLAKLAGAEVGTDPTSADFAKIKLGNTRYDPWAGLPQYVRLMAQLNPLGILTGEPGHVTSSTTGVKMTLGEGYKPLTRGDILKRFFQSKESPLFTYLQGLWTGQNNMGKPFDPADEAVQRFVSLSLQDLNDLAQEYGPAKGLLMSVPGFFGVGSQTYRADAADTVRSMHSVLNEIASLQKRGDIEGARALKEKNVELVRIGKALDGLVTRLNDLRSRKVEVTKNLRLTEEEKTARVADFDTKIKELQSIIDQKYEEVKGGATTGTSSSGYISPKSPAGPFVNPQ